MPDTKELIFKVQGLQQWFPIKKGMFKRTVGHVKAVDDVSLDVYTQALLSAIPVPVIHQEKKRQVLQGEVPSPINKPKGCAFHTRCPYCKDICKEIEPQLCHDADDPEHLCACHLYNQPEAK